MNPPTDYREASKRIEDLSKLSAFLYGGIKPTKITFHNAERYLNWLRDNKHSAPYIRGTDTGQIAFEWGGIKCGVLIEGDSFFPFGNPPLVYLSCFKPNGPPSLSPKEIHVKKPGKRIL